MAKYAINSKDGRLVFATAEVAENPTYFVLHPDTVGAIKNGKLETGEVLKFIRSKSRTADEVAKLRPENVRQTEFPKPDASVAEEEGIKIPVADGAKDNGKGKVKVKCEDPNSDDKGKEPEKA